MATPNVRGAYELLRRAMQQQSLQQQGADFGSTPNAAPEDGSDSYGGPQGGLLGRLLALQAERSRQQPFAGNNGPTSSEALDPNFRQLSRAPVAARPQGAIGPSNRPDDQSRPAYSPFGGSVSFDSSSTSSQNAGPYGVYGGNPTAPWIATRPAMTTFPVGLGRRWMPFPPPPPVTPQPIPMPAIPDSWKAAWEFLQLYPRILSGIDGGGERGGDNWNEQIPGPTLPNWNELSKQQMASRKGGGRSDDDEDDVDPNVWIERFRKQSNARARERGKAVSRPKVGVKRDPRDFCSDRCEEEKKRCGERYPDYAHNHFLWGCETRAEERRNMCTANGGEPRPDELAEWDLDDEELFRNLYR